MKRIIKSLLVVSVGVGIIFLQQIGNAKINSSPQEDKIDTDTAKIGTQIWMSVNLDVDHFRNGDSIPQARSEEAWKTANLMKQPAWCYYENNPENKKKFGKLYNWYAVGDKRGLAPEGWRIPSNADWTKLTRTLGSVDIAGIRLKSTSGWKNGNGNNISRFTALPGGYRTTEGSFKNLETLGQWWSTSGEIGGGPQVYSLKLVNYTVEAMYEKIEKGNGLSVRCFKN